ncbi:MAG: cyanophycin synthetase [Clostridiales bacterium]|nr:cyanophycin synthetase [Clostridiales bacterium]
MHICELKAYKGRNIFSHKPVIKLVIDLENFDNVATKDITDFNQHLLQMFPGLRQHRCSPGYEGGFVERLYEGTYLAHVIEHLSLEIQHCLGYDVSFGKARCIDGNSQYLIVFAYDVECVGLEAARLAIDITEALINQQTIDTDNRLKKLKAKAVGTQLGPSTQALVNAARESDIPIMRIGDGSILQLGYGKYQKRIEATITENTSCIAVDIACDKMITKSILADIGIPVPIGQSCLDVDEAVSIAESIGYPVVVKPKGGNQGKGVWLELNNPEAVKQAFKSASLFDQEIIVEKYIKGRDYRVLVVGDKVIAVSEKIPPYVIGDGHHTIIELVNMINSDERRGDDHERPLTKIKIDEQVTSYLHKNGLNIDSIPQSGQKVYLRVNGNLSTGGIAIDRTDKIHPYNADLALRAARIIGLDVAGIDITALDIDVPLDGVNGAIIEINAAPGIRMHHYPYKGKPRNAAKAIIDMLYPQGQRSSIPIVSVTGSNGKTTTVRIIAHMLRTQGLNVGMTTTGGVYINDECIMKGDTTGPASAQIILSDKSVEAAVLETARGGIIRSGLGYDLSDVGVITNITGDHLGIDGIHTLEDMLHVKSLIVEAVKDNGYAVLNADDAISVQAARRVRCNLIYFSFNQNNILIQHQIDNGRPAVYLKDDYIVLFDGENIYNVIAVDEIPATWEGKLTYNIENSMAAVAAGYGIKVPVSVMEKALRTFYSDSLQNPGRFNIFNIRNFRVIVDYAHNVESYKSVISALKQMNPARLIGVIGAPGDRRDEDIIEMGRIAGHGFDRIIIKEDIELRGRQTGEVSRLLQQGALKAGMPKSSMNIVLSETDAISAAMGQAQPGDIVIVFYERLEPILDAIKKASPLEPHVFNPAQNMLL